MVRNREPASRRGDRKQETVPATGQRKLRPVRLLGTNGDSYTNLKLEGLKGEALDGILKGSEEGVNRPIQTMSKIS